MTLFKLTRRAMLAAGAATAMALSPIMATAQTPPGVLIVGQIAEPKALDPAAVTAVNDFRILMNVYDGLVRYKDGTLEVEPSLATDWTISEDGKTYTFALRDGVTFHDGSPFNAEAVVFNFDRMLKEDHPYHNTGPFPLSFFFSAVENVEATGDDVVGEVDGGMAAIATALNAGQAALSAELLGVSAGAFGMTTGYLKERKQFGRTIGSFQALQHRAAHLFAEIEITASAIANAGRMMDESPEEAEIAVSVAKARATQTAKLAVSEGVQMHGGIGMTDEFDMGFFMKRARVGAEWLGDYGYHAARVAQARGF